jgi:Gluconate 2-dehydrogenase subunit 3
MISSTMKRRRFFKTIAALPAAPALIAQTAPPQAPAAGRSGGASNIPTFQETSPELVADAQPAFFAPPQYAALRRLSVLFMPPLDGNPGALECQAPEFLDFLIGASLPERQKLYRDGLDTLNANAKKKFKKAFAELDDADADAIIRPLLTPVAWAYDAPKDPAVHFIAEARRDIRTATQNSREWAAAGMASGRRRFGGGGTYVLPIDPTYRSQ